MKGYKNPISNLTISHPSLHPIPPPPLAPSSVIRPSPLLIALLTPCASLLTPSNNQAPPQPLSPFLLPPTTPRMQAHSVADLHDTSRAQEAKQRTADAVHSQEAQQCTFRPALNPHSLQVWG